MPLLSSSSTTSTSSTPLQNFQSTESSSPTPRMPGNSNANSTPHQVPSRRDPPLRQRSCTPATLCPLRSLFKTIVTVNVGPTAHSFSVHKEVLCDSSPFFAAAFNKHYSFQESTSDILNLPEARPLDFEYFIQWLYTRTLTHEDLNPPHPAYYRLIRLYALADALSVQALKNKIVDTIAALADDTNSVPTPDDTRVLYEEIEETTPLRKLVVDLFAIKKTDRLVETHEDSWDERFLRDLVVKLKRAEAKPVVAPWRDQALLCTAYHEHKPGQSCAGSEEKTDSTKIGATSQPKPARKKSK